ncbi:MAG: LAGLIDADG family homing endonuclease [Candidatus Baldrarchaeia archaeon]
MRINTQNTSPQIGQLPFSVQTKTFLDIDPFDVSTDYGTAKSSKTYCNGIAKTIKLRTRRGFNIEATLNHRVRVMDPQEGYKWSRMKDVKIGDLVCLARGTAHDFERSYVELIPGSEKIHGNTNKIIWPTKLDETGARFLGLFIGDGNFTTEGIRIAFNSNEKEEIVRVDNALITLFGRGFTCHEKLKGFGVYYNFNSRQVKQWLKQFGLNDTSTKLQIPQQIWDSPVKVKGAFLQGLYDADGSVSLSSKNIELSSCSKIFMEDVQQLLLNLGIISAMYTWKRNCTCFNPGDNMYKLVLSHQEDSATYNSLISFGHNDKKVKLAKLLNTYQSKIPRTRDGQHFDLPENLSSSRIHYEEITALEESETYTYDIEVPEGNAYVANGFVSHNSISIVAECSSGIEPIYAITVERRHDLADHDVIVEINPLFLETAKKREFYSEALIAGIRENNGSCQGVEGVPEDVQTIFKIAADIKPADHVQQLAVWQESIDNAVSKTSNLPSSATKEDVARIFMMAYDLGCKGITVYRDGCRGSQVLSAGVKKQERPDVVPGKTIRVPTSLGTMYINVGIIDDRPFETFVHLSSGGTNAAADAEGLGKMVSLALRTKTSVYDIVKQLKGIGAGAAVFHKGRTITSIPDAIAYALEKYFLDSKVKHPDDHAQFASGHSGAYCKDCD